MAAELPPSILRPWGLQYVHLGEPRPTHSSTEGGGLLTGPHTRQPRQGGELGDFLHVLLFPTRRQPPRRGSQRAAPSHWAMPGAAPTLGSRAAPGGTAPVVKASGPSVVCWWSISGPFNIKHVFAMPRENLGLIKGSLRSGKGLESGRLERLGRPAEVCSQGKEGTLCLETNV